MTQPQSDGTSPLDLIRKMAESRKTLKSQSKLENAKTFGEKTDLVALPGSSVRPIPATAETPPAGERESPESPPLEDPAKPERFTDDTDDTDDRTARVVAVYHWSAVVPTCGRCWSSWYVETVLSTGASDLVCFCCRQPVDGSDQSETWRERQTAKLAASRGE